MIRQLFAGLVCAASCGVASAATVHVAKTGDDDTGLGTKERPYASIAKAISVANAWDTICVQKGTYNETVSNGSVDNLTIAGGYDTNWQRDLVNAQTFVIPPSGQDCLVLSGVVSNVVKGLVLTGGKNGVTLNTALPSGLKPTGSYCTSHYHDLSQLVITNNSNHGINCQNLGGCGLRLVSSLVAKNKQRGVHAVGNSTCGACIFNCTIVDNGTYGIVTFQMITAYDIRNCLITGNDYYYAYSHDSSTHMVLMAHNLAYRPSGYAAHWHEGAVITGGGNLFLEPKMNADWTLKADSPCLGAGMDLSGDPRCAVLEDVYGTPWDGVYDIGCFKSPLPAPKKLGDVYVATDGDDANTGADAAHPLKTPAIGALRLADGGTLHFAAGTYTSGFSITAKGATVRGAGKEKTLFTVGSDKEDLAACFAIDIAADNVTVERLSAVNGPGNGINLAPNAFAREALVRDCEFRGCYVGVRCRAYGAADYLASLLPEDKGESSDTWAYHRLSHCVISNNVTRGIDVGESGYTAMRGDNLLIVRNGTDGVYCRDRNGSGFYVPSYFYYCTIADNGGHGVYNYAPNDFGRPKFYNSVFTGNAVGVSRAKFDDVTVERCVVSGNGCNFLDDYAKFGDTNGTTTAAMEYLSPSSYRLADGCPAIGLARALTASDKIAEPLTDLIGRPRYVGDRAGKRDSGCYVREPHGLMLIVR